jgi:hypothetical protein
LPAATELAAGNEQAADHVVAARQAAAAPRRFRQKQDLD